MRARPFACFLASVLLALPGCGAVPAVRVALAPVAGAVATRVAPPDEPPLAQIDCDGDGHVSLVELQAGFTLEHRAVSAAEFAAADLSKDGAWSASEFARFLNHRSVRSWAVTKPCPAGG
jgi:hypothetical protein